MMFTAGGGCLRLAPPAEAKISTRMVATPPKQKPRATAPGAVHNRHGGISVAGSGVGAARDEGTDDMSGREVRAKTASPSVRAKDPAPWAVSRSRRPLSARHREVGQAGDRRYARRPRRAAAAHQDRGDARRARAVH